MIKRIVSGVPQKANHTVNDSDSGKNFHNFYSNSRCNIGILPPNVNNEVI